MATRILITDSTGRTLTCLDGHHGARHAADWCAAVQARFSAAGVDTIVVELHPAQGGDDFRRNVLQRAGRVHLQLHQRPDGTREIVGVTEGLHGLRLVHAPPDVLGQRKGVRVPSGRQNPPQRASAQQLRVLRKRDRAQTRGTP